ncbi:phage tail tape measure protein [Paenibacillus aurantiacus]|uniref:Phage tail tape measure protein n=1 Tax=Paenibacillus aurantiacus TaxID=1936118 RepID=A0ABV5KQ24_9BACL
MSATAASSGKAIQRVMTLRDLVSPALRTITRNQDRFKDSTEAAARETNTLWTSIRTGSALATRSILRVGGALAIAAGGAAVKGVMMLDAYKSSVNQLQASSGASASEMVVLKKSMDAVYRAGYGEGFDDIAASLANVRQVAGISGKTLEEATANSLTLRDVFGAEIAATTRAASSLVKQFGIDYKQAQTLIAQGFQKGANKNDDFLDTLNEYAVQFKSLGFDANQFTSVLIDGAERGAWSIDKVGDLIKEFNIRSKDLSKTSLDGYKALGLNGKKLSAEFAKGGASAQASFKKVVTALNKVKDPLKRNAIGVQLFGTQFEDLEAGALVALGNISDSADMTADTLKQINKVKYNDIKHQVTSFGRAVRLDLINPLADKLAPTVERAVTKAKQQFAAWQKDGTLDSLANSINDLALKAEKNLPQVIDWFIGMKEPASAVWSAVSGIGSGLAGIASWVQDNPDLAKSIGIGAAATWAVSRGKGIWDNLRGGAGEAIATQNVNANIVNVYASRINQPGNVPAAGAGAAGGAKTPGRSGSAPAETSSTPSRVTTYGKKGGGIVGSVKGAVGGSMRGGIGAAGSMFGGAVIAEVARSIFGDNDFSRALEGRPSQTLEKHLAEKTAQDQAAAAALLEQIAANTNKPPMAPVVHMSIQGTVREEADVQRIAQEMSSQLRLTLMNLSKG